jgi:hypothetical protein
MKSDENMVFHQISSDFISFWHFFVKKSIPDQLQLFTHLKGVFLLKPCQKVCLKPCQEV